jgi:hypothetical protein
MDQAAMMTTGRNSRSQLLFHSLRIAISAILVAAASLKVSQLTESRGGSALGNVFLIGFELVLAFALAFRLWFPRTWQVGMAAFGVFATVALVKAAKGDSSCACFGQLAAPPYLIFLGDTLLLGGMLALRKHAINTPTRFSPAISILLGATAFSALVASQDFSWVSLRSVRTEQGLDPKDWIGRRFPLLDDIDIRYDIETDEWEILFYRPNCSKCDAVLRPYLAAFEARESSGFDPRVAFIEIPGDSFPNPTDAPRAFAAPGCKFGQLVGDSKTWSLPTPLLVSTVNGRVTTVVDDFVSTR